MCNILDRDQTVVSWRLMQRIKRWTNSSSFQLSAPSSPSLSTQSPSRWSARCQDTRTDTDTVWAAAPPGSSSQGRCVCALMTWRRRRPNPYVNAATTVTSEYDVNATSSSLWPRWRSFDPYARLSFYISSNDQTLFYSLHTPSRISVFRVEKLRTSLCKCCVYAMLKQASIIFCCHGNAVSSRTALWYVALCHFNCYCYCASDIFKLKLLHISWVVACDSVTSTYNFVLLWLCWSFICCLCYFSEAFIYIFFNWFYCFYTYKCKWNCRG